MKKNDAVFNYYENIYDENTRLASDSLESIRTKEIISRYLRDTTLEIADIAGGAGHYSFWLAAMGHNVHLLDLSEKHIEQAKMYSERNQIHLASYSGCDALALPYKNEQFDIILVMGALYHLQNPEDRIQCMREAYRTLKAGGTAIFSFISRYASLIDGYRYNFIDDKNFLKIIKNDLATGKHENPTNNPHYFTTAFFHTPQLIKEELSNSGYNDIRLFAVEGFGSLIDHQNIMSDAPKRAIFLEHLRQTEESPELLGVSSHMMACCNKN